MNNINYRKRYKVWRCIDLFISLLPLIVYAFINFDKYFGVKTSALSNVLGFGSLIIVLCIVILKKTEFLQGIGGLILFELILIFLDVYIKDLKFILGMGIAGLLLSSIFIKPTVEKYRRLCDKRETADENANSLNVGFQKIVEAIEKGSGRA